MGANSFGLPEHTIKKLQDIFKEESNIKQVILYGSRAKGNYKPGSDIDLTIIAPNFSLSDLNRIDNKIDDLLLPYTVDLSLFHYIQNPDLVDHLNRVGIEFFRRNEQ